MIHRSWLSWFLLVSAENFLFAVFGAVEEELWMRNPLHLKQLTRKLLILYVDCIIFKFFILTEDPYRIWNLRKHWNYLLAIFRFVCFLFLFLFFLFVLKCDDYTSLANSLDLILVSICYNCQNFPLHVSSYC